MRKHTKLNENTRNPVENLTHRVVKGFLFLFIFSGEEEEEGGREGGRECLPCLGEVMVILATFHDAC